MKWSNASRLSVSSYKPFKYRRMMVRISTKPDPKKKINVVRS